MKTIMIALAVLGTIATAGAAQADTTVIVHRDGPRHHGPAMRMHRPHHPMCRTVTKVVRMDGHVRRETRRVCR